MTKMLALGVGLKDVVASVTSHPARMLRMQESIGTLAPGREADISVLKLHDGAFPLSDNSGVRVIASQAFEPLFCLRAGRRYEADSPLIPPLASEGA
jgi:dihydroorotase